MIQIALFEPKGDILVFLTGQDEIEEVKATLTESSEVTGNRESKPQVGLDNILDIRKLAGLK